MIHKYSEIEEKYNSYTHLFAGYFSIVSTVFLILYSIFINHFSFLNLIVILFFGLSSIFTFFASSKYHKEIDLRKKLFLRRIDHTSIFLTILGTFIPIAYFSVPSSLTFYLFIISEILLSIYGIRFKLKSKKCFSKQAVILYLMLIIPFGFIINSIVQNLTIGNLLLLGLSLISCLLGVPFYLLKSKQWTHVIWHVFVMISSIFSNVLMFNLI